MSTRSYVPTSFELNEAIAKCLLELESQNSDDARHWLLQRHRTWRIPERRVRKFVKRQTGFGNDTDSVMTEDDVVSVTSVRSTGSVMGMVGNTAGRLFRRSTGSKIKPAGPLPVFEIQTTRSLLSQMVIFETEDDEILSPIREVSSPCGDDATPDPQSRDINCTLASELDTPRVVLAELFLDTDPEHKTNGRPATSDMYHDDNDSKRDNRCGLCEGCVIV